MIGLDVCYESHNVGGNLTLSDPTLVSFYLSSISTPPPTHFIKLPLLFLSISLSITHAHFYFTRLSFSLSLSLSLSQTQTNLLHFPFLFKFLLFFAMATQILRPHDCLVERIRAPPPEFSHRRSSTNHCNYYYYNNHVATSRSCRKPFTRPDQRKRPAPASGLPVVADSAALRRSSSDYPRVARSHGLEKVTILRRGQSIDSAVKSDVYAGSAFAVSPSPNALPLPSFPTKKNSSAAFDDSATRDLRRLLRLE
ncbi:hypothetical protein VNO80_22730 [Phaseolus coccineus]|uniref:Uncharacterized protein n=1 Tax=Phaseolus coccineus TaxID=3886 RepID=A0AAN9M4N8_PHACN